MAQRSQFWNTDTSGDGTSTITEAQTIEFFRNILARGLQTAQAILPGIGSELAVSGAAGSVNVAAGAAIVEGYYYQSDATENVSIPTPAGSTRIDRIVLRASHSARTVRITRIAGTEGAGAPSITQTAGTTWDMPLAQVSITTGGSITVTDQRSFVHVATRVDKNQVDGGTSARIPFNDASGRLTDDAALAFDGTNERLGVGTSSPSAPLHVSGGTATSWSERGRFEDAATGAAVRIKSGEVSAGQRRAGFAVSPDGSTVVDLITMSTAGVGINEYNPQEMLDVGGQVRIAPTSAEPPLVLGSNAQGQKVTGLNADQVDGLDLAFNREGGHATNWATAGTTDYTPTNIRTQVGAVSLTFSGASASGAITFPVAFSGTPILTATIYDPANIGAALAITVLTTTGATFALQQIESISVTGTSVTVLWRADGPA